MTIRRCLATLFEVLGTPYSIYKLFRPADRFALARMSRRASAHQSALLTALAAAELAVAAVASARALRAQPPAADPPRHWAATLRNKRMEEKSIGHRLIIEWGKPLGHAGYLHKYGGSPSNGASLPLCQGCKKPFHLLLQIDLADPGLTYLELPALDYLFLFSCLNCASYEKVMYYRLNNRGQEIVVLQQTPSVCVGEYPVPLEEQKVSHRLLKEDEYPKTKEDERRLLSQDKKHQLGGAPLWIQDVEHISCVECGKQMEYIAMVDTELYIGEDGFRERGHMFGDSGTLYTFVCRECGLFASRAQGL